MSFMSFRIIRIQTWREC